MEINILLCIIQESTRKSTFFTGICKGLRGNAKKPHFFASRGDYLDFLKFSSLISRNWGFLENCFSISRFNFFSLVSLFFSIKTNNSNFNTSFIIHLYYREQIVQYKKEVVVFLCLVGGSLRHRGLKSKIYHQL